MCVCVRVYACVCVCVCVCVCLFSSSLFLSVENPNTYLITLIECHDMTEVYRSLKTQLRT